MRLRHHGCGQHATAEGTCARCSQPLTIQDVTMEAEPGGRAGPGTQLIAERLHRQGR